MAGAYENVIFYATVIFVISICAYMYYKNSDAMQLKCIVSSVDGNKYCVRDREKLSDAADLLAKVTQKCKELVKYVVKTNPTDERSKLLHSGFKIGRAHV